MPPLSLLLLSSHISFLSRARQISLQSCVKFLLHACDRLLSSLSHSTTPCHGLLLRRKYSIHERRISPCCLLLSLIFFFICPPSLSCLSLYHDGEKFCREEERRMFTASTLLLCHLLPLSRAQENCPRSPSSRERGERKLPFFVILSWAI